MRSDHLRKHNKTHEKVGTNDGSVKEEADQVTDVLSPHSDEVPCDRMTTSDSTSANADGTSDVFADDDSEVVVD
jgi:hypothetical protein